MTKGRVLVTGATGFTGKYVVNALKQDARFEVYVDNSEACFVDIRDKDQVDALVGSIRPNYVVHLAAISYVAHGSEQDFYHVNVDGTRNLLNAITHHSKNLQQIVVASSANTYGIVRSRDSVAEDYPQIPVNAYAQSKLNMERMILSEFDGWPITITRPFNYTGVGQSGKFLVPKIVSCFRSKEKKVVLGNLDVYRDFSDVRDVATVYKALLEISNTRDIINICSGEAYSIRDIIHYCTEISGHEIEIESSIEFCRDNEIPYLLGSREKLNRVIGGMSPIAFPDTLSWMLGVGI